jgi:thiol-disulfide isomerase/thioredoxin
MDRRQFSLAASGALAGTGLTWGAAAQAQVKKPELGVHYLSIGTPAPTEAPPGKVEVLEFFWYNCPHCNAFEPELAAWLKRMPKHFGALSGYAQMLAERDQPEKALDLMQRAVAVNPNMVNAELLMADLRRRIEIKRKQSV